jgi:hypothetical protein
VIVPVSGRFALAERSLQSVSSQSYRPIELIVVDDASDPAFAPAQPAAGIELRRIRLDTNVGPGAAREAGRREARGEYIAYLDSDDFWGPAHLASLVAALASAPRAGMGYSAALEVCQAAPAKLREWSDVAYDEMLPVLLRRRPWHTSSCLWRRGLSDAMGPWMPLWHYEDYEHDCRAGCLGARLAHVPEPTCFIQTDAPGRLSTSPDERRKVRSYGLVALSMAEQIRGTSWYSDPKEQRVRRRMREILLGVAARAAELEMAGLSAKAVLELWRWDSHSASVAVASGVALPLSLISAGRMSARVFRWARGQSAGGIGAGEIHPAHIAGEPLLELGGGPEFGGR